MPEAFHSGVDVETSLTMAGHVVIQLRGAITRKVRDVHYLWVRITFTPPRCLVPPAKQAYVTFTFIATAWLLKHLTEC